MVDQEMITDQGSSFECTQPSSLILLRTKSSG